MIKKLRAELNDQEICYIENVHFNKCSDEMTVIAQAPLYLLLFVFKTKVDNRVAILAWGELTQLASLYNGNLITEKKFLHISRQ